MSKSGLKRILKISFGIQTARYLLVFLFGVLGGVALPYLLIQTRTLPPYLPTSFEIDPLFLETDVESLNSIESEADVLTRRQELIAFVWGEEGFPETELPATVEADITDADYQELSNLKQINKITIRMEWQLTSIAYQFVPIRSNQKLVIYHQGHYGDFIYGIGAIQKLLKEGYTVIALSMPLLGKNNQPVVDISRIGKLQITKHDQLKFLQPEHGHPIKYFLHPVAVVMNYARQQNYATIAMMGFSGGGWTTTLYAALDPDIGRSYQVAGTLPIFLRPGSRQDWGDYEQTIPELYTLANYPELYVLSAYGEGRKHLQILNKFDPCCYGGIRYQTYEDVVKARVRLLGAGQFEIHVDETNREHKISDQALDWIVADLNGSAVNKRPVP